MKHKIIIFKFDGIFLKHMHETNLKIRKMHRLALVS